MQMGMRQSGIRRWVEPEKENLNEEEVMPHSKYSKKQKKLAAVAPPRKKITGADLKKLRKK